MKFVKIVIILFPILFELVLSNVKVYYNLLKARNKDLQFRKIFDSEDVEELDIVMPSFNIYKFLLNESAPNITYSNKKDLSKNYTNNTRNKKNKKTIDKDSINKNKIKEKKVVDNYNKKISSNNTSISNKKIFSCKNDNDCSFHGTCNKTKNICKCFKGWVTIKTDNENANLLMCDYKQKSKKMTLFLAIFLGFGLEHVYTGNFIYGLLKCFILSFCTFCTAFMNYKLDTTFDLLEGMLQYITLIIFLWILYWYINDIINIWQNRYLDGNGVKLS